METPERMSEMDLEQIRSLAEADSDRIANLGEWPAFKIPHAKASIAGRIPQKDDTNGKGFDAGVACALSMIPPDKQRLAAMLHGNYTPEAVEQVRRELETMDPESQTAWWLAACSCCTEGGVDETKFREQLKKFEELSADPKARTEAARATYQAMASTFSTEKYGFPFGTKDGCVQGAYLAGFPAAGEYSDMYNIYFIGTCLPSLGLEDFPWSAEKDAKGRPNSGPVHGSNQYVKCANEAEFKQALEVVKRHLGMNENKHDKT